MKRIIRQSKPCLLLLLLACCCFSFGQNNGSIRVTAYPGIVLADGHSRVTVTAEVRQQNGSAVPDGTPIVFTTGLGSFRAPVVRTTNGLAQAVLISDTIPGFATITASAVPAYNAVGTFEFEFAASKADLANANDYIEVSGAKDICYSTELKIIEAAAGPKRYSLRYKDIEIEADELQLRTQTYELRAKNAKLKMGKETREYQKLYLNLKRRQGTGFTYYVPKGYSVTSNAPLYRFEKPPSHMAYVAVTPKGIKATPDYPNLSNFEFEDLSAVNLMVSGRQVVVYPTRYLQFHQASLIANGSRVMKLPLFQLNAYANAPTVTEQFVNVTASQLAINYPYYLSLAPGKTSLLRFRTGTAYGQGTGATGGMFLDYELNWNHGSAMDGGFSFAGIGRGDWVASLRQVYRLGEQTNFSGQLNVPGGKGILGAATMGHRFNHYDLTLSASGNKTFTGNAFANSQVALDLDQDPIKIGKHVNFSTGLTAQTSRFSAGNTSASQQGIGLQSRLQMDTLSFGKSTLTASFGATKLFGRHELNGLGLNAAFVATTSLRRDWNLQLQYDYTEDGISSTLVGRHRLGLSTSMYKGNMNFSINGSRSLDADLMSLYSTFSYRLSKLWRFGNTFSLDKYQGTVYRDFGAFIGVNVGAKEIGLSWSRRTKRFGIELLQASFR